MVVIDVRRSELFFNMRQANYFLGHSNYFCQLVKDPFQSPLPLPSNRQRRKKSERKHLNKDLHLKHGNRKCLKIDSWNSGHSQLNNQMNEVKMLVQKRRPHLFLIKEANLWKSQGVDVVKLDGYKIFKTKMYDEERRQCSRVVVYVQNGVKVKQLYELESCNFSSIWLEVSVPHCPKFVLAAVYREHAFLKLDKSVQEATADQEAQENR